MRTVYIVPIILLILYKKVSIESAQEFAEEKECPLIEVSSKSGQGVETLFDKLGQLLINKSQ